MIFGSCGCALKDIEGTGVPTAVMSYSKEGDRAIEYHSYCFKCYRRRVMDDMVLLTPEAEQEWLRKNNEGHMAD